MHFISINTYRHDSAFGDYRFKSGVTFDANAIIEELCVEFPALERLPGDQLEMRIENAAKHLDDSDSGKIVLSQMRRDSDRSGPCFAFRIPIDNGAFIDGLVKRYQMQFGCHERFPNEVRLKIRRFVESVVPDVAKQWIEES
jgi:hypothetical protein